MSVGEAEVVAHPAVVLLIIIYVVRLCLVGLAVGGRHLAQRLRPVALVGAAGLQLMSHIAALELLLRYLLALPLAAGVEVVTVVEGDFFAKGVAVLAGSVRRANVKAVVQDADAIQILCIYKSAYFKIQYVVRFLDETVVKGSLGIEP